MYNSINDLFTHRNDGHLQINFYIVKADTINSLDRLLRYDEQATKEIERAKQLIKLLQEYRQQLFERSKAVTWSNYTLKLALTREVKFYPTQHISYVITIQKEFEDKSITEEIILNERFTGKERHKALKRFKELQKNYPGINNQIDIEKKHWEK